MKENKKIANIQVDKKRCYYCNCILDFTTRNKHLANTATIDHIIPRSKGGVGYKINLLLSCFTCNNIKGCLSIRQLVYHVLNHKSTGIILERIYALDAYIKKHKCNLYGAMPTKIKAGKTIYSHPDAPIIAPPKILGKIEIPESTFEKRIRLKQH